MAPPSLAHLTLVMTSSSRLAATLFPPRWCRRRSWPPRTPPPPAPTEAAWGKRISSIGQSLRSPEGRLTVNAKLRTNWFPSHFALIFPTVICYLSKFPTFSPHFCEYISRFCELILSFCEYILLIEKWAQKEEQIPPLFALILDFGLLGGSWCVVDC